MHWKKAVCVYNFHLVRWKYWTKKLGCSIVIDSTRV